MKPGGDERRGGDPAANTPVIATAPPTAPEADRPASPSARYAHDLLAPELFAMIAEVRRTQVRVVAAAGARADADPEAIHDFRVALRRLRTVLRPARRVFGKRRLREIGAELRRFTQATGALRDEEVLRETLGALDLPPRARAQLDTWLAARAKQERARRRAVVAMLLAPDLPATPQTPARPSLATALAHLERRLGGRRRSDTLAGELSRSTCARAFDEVLALASGDARDVVAMHELRIRWKRLRYSAELFAPALGDRAAPLVKSSTRMQKRLGDLHDHDEALLRVARARGLPEACASLVRRALIRGRRLAAARVRRDVADEVGRVRDALALPT